LVDELPKEKELDLFLPTEFSQALKKKIERPFVFGPITFKGLDSSDFNGDMTREMVMSYLEKTPRMPKDLCIHGFNVLIRDRTLRRSSTILKHARFLKSMKVTPIFPPEPEPSIKEGEPGDEDQDQEDDD